MRITRSSRRNFVPPRLPLVALIDVVLFLLLYFMMAGSLAPVEANLSTTLKTDQRGSGAADLVPQIVNVEAPGGTVRFRLGDRAVPDRPQLTSLLSQLPKAGGVVVRVAGEAPVWSAAAAVQACKDAGFNKVSYVPASK